MTGPLVAHMETAQKAAHTILGVAYVKVVPVLPPGYLSKELESTTHTFTWYRVTMLTELLSNTD